MNEETNGGVHWSFWIISAGALIWNGMGVMNFIMQMSPETLAGYPEPARVLVAGRPTWATGGFAIAVFGGALGCVLLLLRNAAAFHVFVAPRDYPYLWHGRFDNSSVASDLGRYSDVSCHGGVIDLVLKARRGQGLDPLGQRIRSGALGHIHTLFNIIYIIRIYAYQKDSALSANKSLQRDIEFLVQLPYHL
jgi:hypothetical protein